MKKSKYKHVSYMISNGKQKYWRATIIVENGRTWNKICKTEREAAIEADKKLIEMRREPVNILIKK